MGAKIDNLSTFSKNIYNMPMLYLHHTSSTFVGATLSANFLCIIQRSFNFNY